MKNSAQFVFRARNRQPNHRQPCWNQSSRKWDTEKTRLRESNIANSVALDFRIFFFTKRSEQTKTVVLFFRVRDSKENSHGNRIFFSCLLRPLFQSKQYLCSCPYYRTDSFITIFHNRTRVVRCVKATFHISRSYFFTSGQTMYFYPPVLTTENNNKKKCLKVRKLRH